MAGNNPLCVELLPKGGDGMSKLKSIKINGESVYLFDSKLFIDAMCETDSPNLMLEIITGEDDEGKYYSYPNNVEVEMELENGRILNIPMKVEDLGFGKVPGLSLTKLNINVDDYPDAVVVKNEEELYKVSLVNTTLTLEDIRKVVMPRYYYKKTDLKLPLDIIEWLDKQDEPEEVIIKALYELKNSIVN